MSEELWYIRDRNKVTGPFTREQLQALRRRGQLARFHEVSQDRKTWTSASTLASSLATASAAPVEMLIPIEPPAAQPPAARWYYSSGQSPVGPIGAQELLGLLRGGTIKPSTLVWREGMPTWIALRDAELEREVTHLGPSASSPHAAMGFAHPAPARNRGRGSSAWAILGVVLVLAVAGLGLAWGLSGGKNPFVKDPAFVDAASGRSWPHGAGTIRSLADATELASAVGLVICGCTLTEFDGTVTEIYFSTGTCFAVSDRGYLVTNRHVIKEIAKLANAEALRKELEEKTKTKIEPRIWVFFVNQKHEATIRFESDVFDLAVLRVKPERPLPCFRLAPKDDIARGSPVFALGFPSASRIPLSREAAIDRFVKETTKGLKIESRFNKSDFDYVITNGIVSLVKREADTWDLEHTARISSGNSGGPLATSDGTVVGINTYTSHEDDHSAPTFVALGVAQLREELANNVPEILNP